MYYVVIYIVLFKVPNFLRGILYQLVYIVYWKYTDWWPEPGLLHTHLGWGCLRAGRGYWLEVLWCLCGGTKARISVQRGKGLAWFESPTSDKGGSIRVRTKSHQQSNIKKKNGVRFFTTVRNCPCYLSYQI